MTESNEASKTGPLANQFSATMIKRVATMIILAGLLLACATVLAGVPANTWVVCSDNGDPTDCDLRGFSGIQQAVNKAQAHDKILLKSGVYSPVSQLDVKYGDLTIRGAVLIEGKSIYLSAEPGAILDGGKGATVCALLIKNSNVKISNLEIQNFRAELEEDDIYDGHGIVAIDSEIQVNGVVLQRIKKMSVSLFGNSSASLVSVQILDGHIGIWMNDETRIQVSNSIFKNNDSAAVAAYGQSSGSIVNSIVEGNLDDGIYAAEAAELDLRNSILIANKPYAVRAVDSGSITLDYSILYKNEAPFYGGKNDSHLNVGEHVYHADPELDARYLPRGSFTANKGDPEVRNRDGSVSDIGLFGGPEKLTSH